MTINTQPATPANTISQPVFVTKGSIVTVTPSAGGSCVVEYSLNSQNQIAQGAATWAAWPKGTVTATTSDMANFNFYMRLSPTINSATLSWDDEPAQASMVQLTGVNVWRSSSAQAAASNAVLTSNNATVTVGNSKIAYGIDANGSYSNSHIAWCNEKMRSIGQPGFEVTVQLAVPGSTLDDLIASQLSVAIAQTNCQVCWMHAGVNNLASGGLNDTLTNILSKFTTIITALAAAKKIVIVDSIDTVAQSGSTSATPRSFTIPTVNALIKQLCSQFTNVIFNDVRSVIVDPASIQLNPLANMLRTDDGIHWVSNGARTAGEYSFNNISGRVKLTPYKTAGTNVLPAFSGTGGTVTPGSVITITGTPPVGWELLGATGLAATHAVTISAKSPDMISLAHTNAGGTTAGFQLKVSNLQANFTAGKTVQAVFGFQASGLVLMQRLGLIIRINGATSWNAMTIQATNEPTITYPQTAHGGYRATFPFVIPAGGLTNVEFIITTQIGPTTGAATYDIFSPQLFVLN